MKEDYFNNKVAVITGSGQGIGKKTGLLLAERGSNVVLNCRTCDDMENIYQEFKNIGKEATIIKGDVSIIKDAENLINETFNKFGKIDILINNAGISAKGLLEECPLETYKKMIDVNLLGSVYTTKIALPYIKKTKGHIVFVSSLAGINGLPFYSSYSSSKMALTAVAESLKLELHKQGVHVGIVYVSFTENDPNKKFYNSKGELETLPKRNNVKLMPVEKTAKLIIKQIEKRKFKAVHSALGKLNWYSYKLFPKLVEFTVLRSMKKF